MRKRLLYRKLSEGIVLYINIGLVSRIFLQLLVASFFRNGTNALIVTFVTLSLLKVAITFILIPFYLDDIDINLRLVLLNLFFLIGSCLVDCLISSHSRFFRSLSVSD